MPSDRTSRSWLVAVLATGCITLAACSAPHEAGDGDAATPAPATADDAPLDWCSRMPVAAVATTLQRTAGVTVTAARPGVGGMCSYSYVDAHGTYVVKLLVDISRMRSARDAQGAMEIHRQDFLNTGRRPQDAGGLGESAYTVAGENMGLVVREGRYYGQVNLAVDNRDPASLRPAVLALGAQALATLQH